MTERKELIERLRWHAKNMYNGDMYREAADMLEADVTETNFGNMPAVPQEPVAWYEYNAGLDAWFLAYGHNPKAKTRPLVFGDAAPQQRSRLDDQDIFNAIHNQVDDLLDHIYENGTTAEGVQRRVNAIARAVEKKVRGEE